MSAQLAWFVKTPFGSTNLILMVEQGYEREGAGLIDVFFFETFIYYSYIIRFLLFNILHLNIEIIIV